jgi:hypothetical protein
MSHGSREYFPAGDYNAIAMPAGAVTFRTPGGETAFDP